MTNPEASATALPMAAPVEVQTFDMANDLQRILSARQVAHWLRLSVEEVERMAECGAIPARRCESEWRFGAFAINAWLGSKRTEDALVASIDALRREVADLPDSVNAQVSASPAATGEHAAADSQSAEEEGFRIGRLVSFDALEEAYIRRVLVHCRGNKGHAAEVLGIDPSTLYRKLSRYSWADPASLFANLHGSRAE